ncbi:hypothetical protein EXS45_01015 [Candidatus Nomurabacteria bacterium]|nr:hypothetical protein [Candidatus Nomurabacteria bacterium]
MSKRNFILLIIVSTLVATAILGFLYLRPKTPTPIDDIIDTNFISQFNPFGNSKPPTKGIETSPVDVSGYEPNVEEETPKVKLIKISSMPIAGFTVFIKERLKEIPIVNTTPPLALPLSEEGVPPAKGGAGGLKTTKPTPPLTEFMPALRYVAKATGNIYQTFADKIEERKFSTTTIPKVYEAYFGNRGEFVSMRYLKGDERTIETFVGALPKELLGGDMTENNEIKGSFLPNNVKDISISPDTSKVFYLWTSGESMIGTTLNLKNNKKVQVFDSPFTEWLSQWPTDNIITLTTKPSVGVPGYIYTIDGSGKNLTKVLGEINGLTTLVGPNGKLVLYGNNNLSLNIYHTDTRNSDLLGVRTLPEKCVWSKISDAIYCAVPKSINSGDYPDTWYQGEVSFNDQIWKIDAKTGNTTLILDLATLTKGEEIDSIKLTLDESENYLFFVNKKDSFLWKLELK